MLSSNRNSSFNACKYLLGLGDTQEIVQVADDSVITLAFHYFSDSLGNSVKYLWGPRGSKWKASINKVCIMFIICEAPF